MPFLYAGFTVIKYQLLSQNHCATEHWLPHSITVLKCHCFIQSLNFNLNDKSRGGTRDRFLNDSKDILL